MPRVEGKHLCLMGVVHEMSDLASSGFRALECHDHLGGLVTGYQCLGSGYLGRVRPDPGSVPLENAPLSRAHHTCLDPVRHKKLCHDPGPSPLVLGRDHDHHRSRLGKMTARMAGPSWMILRKEGHPSSHVGRGQRQRLEAHLLDPSHLESRGLVVTFL